MESNVEKTFGTWLQEQRTAKKITLEEIAAVTKVHIAQLKNIESDQLTKLPPMAFVRGFLVSYAHHVGIDENEVLTRFKDAIVGSGHDLSPLPKTSKIAKTKSDAEVKIVNAPDFRKSVVVQRKDEDDKPLIQPKTAAWIGAVFILLAILVTLVFIGKNEMQPKTEVAQNVAGSETQTGNSPAVPSEPATTAVPTAAVTVPSTPPPTPAPAAPAPTPTVANTASSAAPSETPTAAKNLTLEVSVSENTWISVRADSDRARQFNLTNGAKQIFSAERRIMLSLSNAGAVQLKWNGEYLGTPGYRGDVKSIILPDELMELKRIAATKKEGAPAVKKVAPSAPAAAPVPSTPASQE